MGNPGVYHDDNPPKLSVRFCGQPDGAGDDQDFPELVSDQKEFVFWNRLPAASDLYGQIRFLRGTFGGRDIGVHYFFCVLLYLQEVS